MLTYGLELLSPGKKSFEKLDLFQKKTIKHILSIPVKAADPVVYILTGLLPMEGLIDLKSLNFFRNICTQEEESMERRILERQLQVKSTRSKSWAICIQNLLWKYDLQDIQYYLTSHLTKQEWKNLVESKVVTYWKHRIELASQSYSSLKYLNKQYTYGEYHPLLQVPCRSSFEVSRMPARMRILTGTITLQSTRAKFNQNDVDPRCVLCHEEPETVEHFLYNCEPLSDVRQPIIQDISNLLALTRKGDLLRCHEVRVQALIDCSEYIEYHKKNWELFCDIEFHVRRLIYAIYVQRLKLHKAIATG